MMDIIRREKILMESDNMKKDKLKNKQLNENVEIKIVAMLCSTILGVISLIGVFWGKDGLIFVGISIMFVVLISLLMVVMIK